MAKGDDIEERLIDFAVRIINVCTHLPKTSAGRHVAGQLIRSGTAPAPNYAEARGAESTNDFIHKLKVCLKELNESRVWLLSIKKSKMLSVESLADITKECDELCRIINSSIKTSRARNEN
ncbi:MAG: four helix bundle protein [Caldilineaceae bacterium]